MNSCSRNFCARSFGYLHFTDFDIIKQLYRGFLWIGPGGSMNLDLASKHWQVVPSKRKKQRISVFFAAQT